MDAFTKIVKASILLNHSLMATTSDITKGCFLKYNNELITVVDYDHITPGKGNAIYSLKCRNVKTGKQSEVRFRSGEKVDIIRVSVIEMQYLYAENDSLVCMHQETFEQVSVPKIIFGDSIKFLQEGMILIIRFDDEEQPVDGLLPKYVELPVTYTEKGMKGDSSSKTLKPAEVEGSIKIQVPLFVEIGDKLKISTETGEYVERVMK
jgi:elongation factor P